MTRLLRRPFAVLLTLPLALALLFATSTAAEAGTGYTGNSTGAVPQVDWHTDYVNMGCASMSVTGQRDAAGLPATLASSTWTNCIGPLGLRFVFTQIGIWTFVPIATVGSVTTGVLQDVDFSVVAINPTTGLPDPSLCGFEVQGDALATYDSATDQLAINHSQSNASSVSNPLAVTSATGCFGQILAGDAFYLETALQLT